MTAKTKTIYDTLHRIQKDLKVPKNNENKFGGYKFRSCEDILEALKKHLEDGETILLNDDIQMIGDRYYVKSTASLCSGAECISASGFAREADTRKGFGEDQITGAASSYARKYALNALFLIDDTKDADATNDGQETKPEPKAEPKKAKSEASDDEKEMRRKYKLVMEAIKTARDHKTLNTIWHLQESAIKEFPAAGQKALEDAHTERTNQLSVVMAG